MVSADLGIVLGMIELRDMYNIKKNGMDEGRVYMSVCSGHGLVLKLL